MAQKKRKKVERINLRSATPGMSLEISRTGGVDGTRKFKDRILVMEIKSSEGRKGFTVLHVDAHDSYHGPGWGTYSGDERCKILKGKEEHEFLRSIRSNTLSRLFDVKDHLREIETMMYLKKVHPCLRRERP